MFSKWFGLALTLSLVCGCAKRGVSAQQPINVDLKGDGACLSDMSHQLGQFFDGKLSAQQTAAFWDCISSDVKEFRDLTAGDGPDGKYSDQALREFLQHYFIKNGKVDDRLLASMMKLKRVFLSGGENWLTPDELDRLQTLLGVFKDASLKIQPHAKVLFHNQDQASDTEIHQASAALNDALDELSAWLQTQNQSYGTDDFDQLASELSNWMANGGTPSTIMDSLKKASLVLPDAKAILIGGNKNKIAGDEWSRVFDVFSQGYFAYMASRYSFADNIDAGFNRDIFPDALESIVATLKSAAALHKNSEIPLSEWHNLFVKIEKTKWLSKDITADAADKFLVWILKRGLGDGTTAPTGFNLTHAAALETHIARWRTLLAIRADDPSTLNQEFNAMLGSSVSLVWDSEGRVLSIPDAPAIWSSASRHHMVWAYVIVRWLKEAFVGPSVVGMSEAQVTAATKEVLPLLQNFGWLKDSQDTIGKRRMREADLFTISANGDQLLDINEATRFLELAVSSYRNAQIWLEEAAKTCGSPKADCLRGLPLNTGNDVLASMPHLLNVARQWPAGQFLSFMKNAEQAALGGVETGDYSTTDLLETVQVMAYVETFLDRFDKNASETIDLNEAVTSFPLFAPTLAKIVPGTSDDVFAFFTFMMKYGDTPFNEPMGGSVMFNHWRLYRDDDSGAPKLWKFEADRMVLMNILAQLSKL